MSERYKIFRNDSCRLPYWDYSEVAYYYVTICVKNREMHFGEIIDEQMHLSEIGQLAKNFWDEIPRHFNNVKNDVSIIMPNHLHGITRIIKKKINAPILRRDAPWRVPTENGKRVFGPLQPKSLSSIVNSYKGAVKRYCNKNKLDFFEWQPNYYEHIIREEADLERIRNYIIKNPQNWLKDKNNELNLYY